MPGKQRCWRLWPRPSITHTKSGSRGPCALPMGKRKLPTSRMTHRVFFSRPVFLMRWPWGQYCVATPVRKLSRWHVVPWSNWNCEALATRHPGELSAGESLRVALAALTLTSPKLLLLDEPLGPLSAHSRTEVVCQLVKYSLTQGATVIMSDHGNREAGGLDGESVVLGSGGLSQGVFIAPRWELPERAPYIKPDPDLVMDVADISVEFGNRRISGPSRHPGETGRNARHCR